MFILAAVLSTLYASYTGTFRIVGETESQAEIYQMAHIAFERILEDLEAAYVPKKAATPDSTNTEEPLQLVGEDKEIEGRSADSLRFASRAHLVFGEQDLSCQTAEIGYYVEESEEEEGLVLYRSDTPQLGRASEEGVRGLPLCKRLSSVDFTYYDSEGEEYRSWSEEGIPQRVSISLEFVNLSDPEAPLKFVTTVALRISEVKEEKG